MKVTVLAYNAHKNCAEGVARIHYNLYSSLKHMGVEVNLISIIDMDFERTFTLNSLYEIDSEHEFYIILGTNGANGKTLKVAKNLLIKDPDFVINGLSGIKTGVYLRLLKVFSFKNWKFIESLFSRPFRFLDKFRYLIPSIFRIFVYSPSEYKYLNNVLPFISSKISLIPPPIDINHFIKKDRRQSLSMLGLDELEDKILIGYVGNPFSDRLPLLETFKALASLVSRHNIAFIGVFPPYKGRTFFDVVYRIARSFNLERRIFIIEKFIDHRVKPFLYSSFDVLLHLYKWREAPYPFLTTLEALSTETPVITTNYNEICWVLGNLNYPLLVDLTNGVTAVSIKSALETYLNWREVENMKLLLSSIRARIAKLFSFEYAGRKVLSILEGCKSQ